MKTVTFQEGTSGQEESKSSISRPGLVRHDAIPDHMAIVASSTMKNDIIFCALLLNVFENLFIPGPITVARWKTTPGQSLKDVTLTNT